MKDTIPEAELDATPIDRLTALIETRKAVVGVIGLGYVGLPLALLFRESDFPVTGFDADQKKVDALRRGESYIRHIGADRVATAFAADQMSATTDFARLAACDAIIIAVPTPLGIHREPDLSYIRNTADEIARHIRSGQLVVLESTTYPGTTREELLPRFEATGPKCGEDFFLAFSPEREDPGNTKYNTKNIPKIVGGIDELSQRVAVALYGSAVDTVVPVSSPEVAESSKLLENIFRSVNIALVNEMKKVLDRMGIDIWDVIDAAKTKPFDFMPFHPGPGLGAATAFRLIRSICPGRPPNTASGRASSSSLARSTPRCLAMSYKRPSTPSTSRGKASKARESAFLGCLIRPTSTMTAKARHSN